MVLPSILDALHPKVGVGCPVHEVTFGKNPYVKKENLVMNVHPPEVQGGSIPSILGDEEML